MIVVALSDTHQFRPDIPDGDVLIHAGDIANRGEYAEMREELRWLSRQPHAEKLYVPGNHDQCADVEQKSFTKECADIGISMLVDSMMILGGISFYGYPWTPLFGWTQGFMRKRELMHMYAARIPECDVLISHGPPAGILDTSDKGMPIGCSELLNRVQKIQPSAMIFGHIHTRHGATVRHVWPSDKETFFANVAYCKDRPQGPSNDPILVLDVVRNSSTGRVEVTDLRAAY